MRSMVTVSESAELLSAGVLVCVIFKGVLQNVPTWMLALCFGPA